MTRDYDDESSSPLATLIDEEKSKSYNEVETPDSKPHFLHRHKLSLTIVSLFLLFTPFLYFIIKATAPYDQCGTSPAEARRRGCVFETTGFTWLPRACLDPAIEDEFIAHIKERNLTYHRDYDCTELVSLEEAQLGEQRLFVREAFHKAHCAFLLRKMHSRYAEGKPIDGVLMSQDHTKHCVSEMEEGEMMQGHASGQLAYPKYPYCGKMGGYNLRWPEQGTWS